MSRALVLALFATAILHSASIRGTVVDNQSGRALSRVAMDLQPVAGARGTAKSLRTNLTGGFDFSHVEPGMYLLRARKRGFMPGEYGQKRWNSAGTPISITTQDDSPFLSLRLFRYGAITGAVLDENDIGLSDQGVVAYRNTQPPQIAARGTSDDRGVYRIAGLEPGEYMVRTTGYSEEDIPYAPTFSKQTLRVEEARAVVVYPDEEAKDNDIRPLRDRLFKLTGRAEPTPSSAGPVNITLASDLGRIRAVGPDFAFLSLPPGRYELLAELQGSPPQAAYLSFFLGGDTVQNLTLQPVRESHFEFTPRLGEPQLMIRRKDLAGSHEAQPLKLRSFNALLPPGRWEFLLLPPPGQYVSGFVAPGMPSATRARPDGWNEATITPSAHLEFRLASGAGTVQGVVRSSGGIVPGAPVFLEAYDPNTHQRPVELRETRTDIQGRYNFEGLAPGVYRLLATFEYIHPDIPVMEAAGSRTIRSEAQSSNQVDLDLYVIR